MYACICVYREEAAPEKDEGMREKQPSLWNRISEPIQNQEGKINDIG